MCTTDPARRPGPGSPGPIRRSLDSGAVTPDRPAPAVPGGHPPGLGQRPLIVYADGPDSPDLAPSEVARLTGLGPADVLMGWTLEGRRWLDDDPSVTGWTVMAGYGLAGALARGQLTYLPVKLSAMGRFLTGLPPADVVVVPGVRRGGGFAYRRSAGWAPVAAQRARAVVVDLDEDAPDVGTPDITGPVAAVVPRRWGPPNLPRYGFDEVTEQIARRVVEVLPDRPTVQFGPSAVTEGVLRVLERPVSVWSGLVTEAVLDLAGRGLVEGPAVATHLWGGPDLDRAAADGLVRTLPASETHDPGRLGALERYVALNTALQVGLDGSVNVERIGGRAVAGMGGHPDFASAAAHSVGGLSVIALRAAHRGRSTIVPRVEVVTTPRTDVDVVVTEHGLADLRGVDDRERARRLVAVAAPEHRPALEAAAREAADREAAQRPSGPGRW